MQQSCLVIEVEQSKNVKTYIISWHGYLLCSVITHFLLTAYSAASVRLTDLTVWLQITAEQTPLFFLLFF